MAVAPPGPDMLYACTWTLYVQTEVKDEWERASQPIVNEYVRFLGDYTHRWGYGDDLYSHVFVHDGRTFHFERYGGCGVNQRVFLVDEVCSTMRLIINRPPMPGHPGGIQQWAPPPSSPVLVPPPPLDPARTCSELARAVSPPPHVTRGFEPKRCQPMNK